MNVTHTHTDVVQWRMREIKQYSNFFFFKSMNTIKRHHKIQPTFTMQAK